MQPPCYDRQTPPSALRLPEPPRRTEPVHVPVVMRERCPEPAAHYQCRTVDGVDADQWTALLGERYAEGYRLLQVVPVDDRSMLIFVHDHG